MTGGVGDQSPKTENVDVIQLTERRHSRNILGVPIGQYRETSANYRLANGSSYGNTGKDPFMALNYVLLNVESNRVKGVPETIRVIVDLLPESRGLRSAIKIRVKEHARSLGDSVKVDYIDMYRD